VNRTRLAGIGLAVPGLMALGMSANTSYRFLGTRLGIAAHAERLALAGTAEAAIIALCVYAWATRTRGPARLALAAVLVQAIPAYTVSGGIGGTIRVFLGPVLLAVLLHLLLGLEVRAGGQRPDSMTRAAVREVRERLTAWLGLGRRGTDSAAIARSRAADRAVALADRLCAARPGSRAHGRLTARLAAAIDTARHGLEHVDADRVEREIVARIVRRKSVEALARIQTRHRWSGLPPIGEREWRPLSLIIRPEPVVDDDTQDGPGDAEDTTDCPAQATSTVALATPRRTVTEVVTLTPTELRRRAARVARRVLAQTGRQVTTEQLRTEFNLSRRDAAELRRQVVTASTKEGA
jgi:hypothetical protein